MYTLTRRVDVPKHTTFGRLRSRCPNMVVNKVTSNTELDVEDPVEQMLKKTGCTELHYQIQECIAETHDWRKCKEHVKKFKDCMTKYKQQQNNFKNN